MKPKFADTWFFLALLNERDSNHLRVVAHIKARQFERIVTTRWVLAETANAFARSRFKCKVGTFLQQLEADPAVEVLGMSDSLFQQGLHFYSSRPDQTWSLTDCISFVVMEEKELEDALTGDHHFAQAGFIPLFA